MGGSYHSAEVQFVYSTAPTDWATLYKDVFCIKKPPKVDIPINEKKQKNKENQTEPKKDDYQKIDLKFWKTKTISDIVAKNE